MPDAVKPRIATADMERIASLLGHLIPNLKDSRIFITGGTGFFGKWLVESLLHLNDLHALNCQLVVLSRNPAKFLERYPHFVHPSLSWHSGDIKDFSYPAGDFDYCIHAALEGENLHTSDELDIFNAAYKGTLHILEFARQKQVRSTLYISSGGVYGKQPVNLPLVPETYMGAPDTSQLGACYGEGKRTGEFLCTYYGRKHGMQVKIARCFAFAGAYLPLDVHFVFGNFLGNCLRGEPILIKGDGTTIRSYMYAGDLVVSLLHTLVHGENLLSYNIGSDMEVSIGELANKIASHFTPSPEITIMKQKADNALPERYIPDINRLRASLPVDFLSLDETITRTVAWYKQHFAG